MEARHRWRTKTDERSEIIELIEEIDGINVNDTAIILDLVCWLSGEEAQCFLDHVRRVRDFKTREEEEVQEEVQDGVQDGVQDECKFFSSLIPEC